MKKPILFFTLFFVISIANAQPTSILLSGFDDNVNFPFDGVDGEYIDSGIKGGNSGSDPNCICYNNINGNSSIFKTIPGEWLWKSVPCNVQPGQLIDLTSASTSCNILEATPLYSNTFIIDPSIPVPTLSEWSLIILGLCLSIVGLVVIRQQSFSYH